jgi:hypothetical protein
MSLIIKTWIKNVHLKNWTPSQKSVLCSAHFEDKYFLQKLCKRRLSRDAVPPFLLLFQNIFKPNQLLREEF